MPPSPPSDAAGVRGRAIRSAVFTSLLSKGGNVLLQLIAMPLAYRELGKEQFGVFGIAAALLGVIHLMEIGVGPSLTSALARLAAAGERGGERKYFCSAVVTTAVLALLGIGITAAVLFLVPVTTLFGEDWAAFEGLVLRVCFVSLGIVFFEFVFGVADRARSGYQETHINNLWGTSGNIIAGGVLAVGIHFVPSVEFLLLVVYGIPALLRGGNAITLIRGRPHLVRGRGKLSFAVSRELAADGLLFSVAQNIVPISQRQGGAFIAAHLGGPAAVGKLVILLQVSTFLLGFVVMFTYPLWPAVADAIARNDAPWVRQSWRKISAFGGAYGLAAIAGMAVAGPFVFGLWLDDPGGFSRGLLVAFAFYFAAMVWNHVHYMVLLGLRELKPTAAIATGEALLVMVAAYAGMRGFGMPGLFIGMGLAILSVTGWVFPLLVRRNLALHEGGPAGCSARGEDAAVG